MKLDKKKLKENMKTISLLAIIVAVLLIFSIFINPEQKELPNIELEESNKPITNKLIINEVVTSNGGVTLAPNGNLYDWIEIYNGKNKEINLKGYGLSDEANSVKYSLPDINLKPNAYTVIYLAGNEIPGPYANFSLRSGGGETLTLRNPSGKVIDALETKKIKKNSSFVRNNDGSWSVTNTTTPGFENSQEGYKKYITSITDNKEEIVISEILPRNKGNFLSTANTLDGFIEIKNTTEKDIEIENYSISNELEVPFKMQLPKKTLKPNEVLVIYTGNNKTEDKLYADFNLNPKTGTVVLTNNTGQIINTVKYENLANGLALTKINNEMLDTEIISPGYDNTTDGVEQFQKENLKNKPELIINEVMNNNTKYIPQNGEEYYDLIELKNNSPKEINLKDYTLSNSDEKLNLASLPDKVLAPSEIIVLIASGNEKYTNQTYNHLNFKLSSSTGLYLSKKNKIIDSVFIHFLSVNTSYGRNDHSGYFFIDTPTPGKENNTGLREYSFKPNIMTQPGVFNDVNNITFELSAPGEVYYTTDGSEPDKFSKKYTEPLELIETTIIKTKNYEQNKKPSLITTSSYIINENHTIPVMSVSLDEYDLKALHNNAWTEGYKVESYAELYEKDQSFSIPCAFKLFGGSTRGDEKKSYTLKFQKDYGASYLDYKVFDTRESNRYDSLVLRTGSQDAAVALIRDEVATSLVDGKTNVATQAYKPVILYINGDYWGIYYLREQVDEDYISNQYNISSEGTNIVRIDGDVKYGSSKDYYALLDYVSSKDMTKKENYEYIKTKVNIESVIDFWIGESYTANNDIVNQRYYNNPNYDNGKWNMIFYDLDYGFYNFRFDYFQFMTSSSGMTENGYSTVLLRNLMKNEEFKKTFLERLSYNLKEVWTKESLNKKIEQLENTIKPEMERNQKRWNQTMKQWYDGLDELKNFVKERESYYLRHVKSFFYLSDAEMSDYFGN